MLLEGEGHVSEVPAYSRRHTLANPYSLKAAHFSKGFFGLLVLIPGTCVAAPLFVHSRQDRFHELVRGWDTGFAGSAEARRQMLDGKLDPDQTCG